MRRRIKSAQVKFISLVPRGANKLPVLYKSADATCEFQALTKLGDSGELLAVVYAPEVRDSQGDIASAEVIKAMAYGAAKDGVEIDLRHDGQPIGKDRAFIAEKFIVAKGDARFADWKDYDGKPVDLTGAWAIVVKIDDPKLRELYREGKWNGVSLFGPAQVEIEKTDIDAGAVADALAQKLKHREPDMTLEEIKKMLDERDARLVATFVEKIGAGKPTEPKQVEFDPLDIKQVEQRLAKMEREAAASKVDWNDPEAVRAYRDSLRAGAGVTETAEARVSRLEKEAAEAKAKLARLQKASTLPVGDKPERVVEDGLSKDERDALAEGKKMAEIANAARGFAKK